MIVEHTNINPNKAAHIGHLRNAVLGDTLVRMLRELGHEVEVQNYIDNTGRAGGRRRGGVSLPREEERRPTSSALIDDPECQVRLLLLGPLRAGFAALRRRTPHHSPGALKRFMPSKAARGPLAELGRIVSDAIVRRHLDTMARIGVRYDLLPRESEILHLKFWASAFELLKERKAIHFETEGKNKGCWVMPAELFQSTASGQCKSAQSEPRPQGIRAAAERGSAESEPRP